MSSLRDMRKRLDDHVSPQLKYIRRKRKEARAPDDPSPTSNQAHLKLLVDSQKTFQD